MVRSRQASRRKVARRRSFRPSAIIRRVENVDVGVEFTPPLDQPSWASAPWWPLTVVFQTEAASTPYSYKAIHAGVLTALSLTGKGVAFEMRLQTVRIWGLDKQPITLEISSNGPTSCQKLKQLNDRGNPVHFSRLGWRFGRSSFAMLQAGCSNSEVELFRVSTPALKSDATKGLPIAVYVQLLIQLTGVKPVTVVNINHCPKPQSSQDLAHGFEMLTT